MKQFLIDLINQLKTEHKITFPDDIDFMEQQKIADKKYKEAVIAFNQGELIWATKQVKHP